MSEPRAFRSGRQYADVPANRTCSLYRRTLREVVYVRRFSGSGPSRPAFDTAAHAKITGDRPDVLIGTVNQFDYSVILFVQDLLDAGFVLPITTNDKLVYKGKEYAIMFPDNATRTDDAELIAYEIKIKG